MKISQSLIKAIEQPHCAKQIYFSFVEGKELREASESMKIGRYFESELIGAARDGIEPAKYKEPLKADIIRELDKKGIEYNKKMLVPELKELGIKNGLDLRGEKLKPYQDCDELIKMAKEQFKKLGLDDFESQVHVKTDLLNGTIDMVAHDIENPLQLANYDIKWTGLKIDDRWQGWDNVEEKREAEIQAAHYTQITEELTGERRPFYYLVFGKDLWFRIFKVNLSNDAIMTHRNRIANTAATIREYALNDYKGTGGFNMCLKCPFWDICEDRKEIPEVENVNY